MSRVKWFKATSMSINPVTESLKKNESCHLILQYESVMLIWMSHVTKTLDVNYVPQSLVINMSCHLISCRSALHFPTRGKVTHSLSHTHIHTHTHIPTLVQQEANLCADQPHAPPLPLHTPAVNTQSTPLGRRKGWGGGRAGRSKSLLSVCASVPAIFTSMRAKKSKWYSRKHLWSSTTLRWRVRALWTTADAVCACACGGVYTFLHIHMYIFIYICECIYVCIRICIHVHMCIYT